MDTASIDYPAMIRQALRGVVREALGIAARDGLCGEHHFYLSFDTKAPGVMMPRPMRDLHPERMTIILQHQYWDLEVDEERFAVTLSFGGQRQRLTIPFAAILAFADPSVGLELRFEEPPVEPGELPESSETSKSPRTSASPESAESSASSAPVPTAAMPPPGPPAGGGGVLPFSRPRRR